MNKNIPLGTLINVATVIIGGIIGLLLQEVFTKGMETLVFQALGLGTILIGLKMSLKLPDGYMLIVIFSLLIGGIFGELVHLDDAIFNLSESLKSIIGSEEGQFSEGLITAFLLFCIGSMTIIGAIEEGLGKNRELLIIKSTLDGFSSIALAATLGVGVIFSVIPMLIFQGGLTISAKRLESLFDETTIDMISTVGGLLIIGISINMLGLGKINLENLLPALIFAVLFTKVKIRKSQNQNCTV